MRSINSNNAALRHGHAANKVKSPEYQSWANMKDRCMNPGAAAFEYYGGRGIKVCDRWLRFDNFLADVGPRPSLKYSLDRFPNKDGDYEPGNCRWATFDQQVYNRANTLMIEKDGQSIPIKKLCEQLGLSYNAVRKR
jgi:hypothetical protein